MVSGRQKVFGYSSTGTEGYDIAKVLQQHKQRNLKSYNLISLCVRGQVEVTLRSTAAGARGPFAPLSVALLGSRGRHTGRRSHAITISNASLAKVENL